jgi:NADPH2:quinone reductase
VSSVRRAALSVLARGGRIVLVGFASGSILDLDVRDLLLRNRSAIGVLASPGRPEQEKAAWERLTGLVAEGRISTPLGPIHEFADVPLMIRRQAAPPPGKSVVRVAPGR